MRKKIFSITLFVLPAFFCFGQENRKIEGVCNCQIKVDSIISKNEDSVFAKKNLHLNKAKSYVTFITFHEIDSTPKYKNVFLNDTGLLKYYNRKFKAYTVSLTYGFKPNIFIGESKINCDNIRLTKSEDINDKISLFKKVKKGELINVKNAITIAKKNGIKNPNSFDLSYDPRWAGHDKYDEDEKTWKPVWTIKQNSNKGVGVNAIKIDSRTGQVLYKYKEFKID